MFPELFKIPGINFTVNTYGVLLAIGFLTGMMLAGKLAQEDRMNRGAVLDVTLYSLLASLIGSRLLLVITEWQSFRTDWKQLLSFEFLRSGGVFYGGLLGAMLASIFLMRWYKLPWFRTADACAPGIALGQFFGRLGCFSAGCCWGKPTSAWCGVNFTEKAHELTGVPFGIALHPTQLYESLATLVLCVFLYFLFKRRAFHGQIILAYLWGYGLIRFVIEFWRDDPRGAVWIFSTSQFIALSCSVFALAAILVLRRRVPTKELEVANT
jgi:phosphatidylglycerol---prolipoprotein diacylglyceryl transferase